MAGAIEDICFAHESSRAGRTARTHLLNAGARTVQATVHVASSERSTRGGDYHGPYTVEPGSKQFVGETRFDDLGTVFSVTEVPYLLAGEAAVLPDSLLRLPTMSPANREAEQDAADIDRWDDESGAPHRHERSRADPGHARDGDSLIATDNREAVATYSSGDFAEGP